MPLTANPIKGETIVAVIADASDAPALAAVHVAALPPGWPAETFAAYCGAPNCKVLKACGGSGPCGLAVLQFAAAEAEILTLAVAADFRRLGAGSRLLATTLDLCRKTDTSRIYLEVAEGNTPALSLYAKFGFVAVGRRPGYYVSGRAEPEAALIMMKELTPAEVASQSTGRNVSLVDHQGRST
jgi:ribosomal-protein-alanine N-acetyltransferase